MEDLVDAFLYLGPQDLRLVEQTPADIALDVGYRMEVRRRESLPGYSGASGGTVTIKEIDQQIVNRAEKPLFVIPKAPPPDPKFDKDAVQSCLDAKAHSNSNSPPPE